ncbi:hypothetical protein AQ490_26730 [Wenjunlia vitaminophila]|uniref:Uncharacterized protein n=1 Tax=Wenjunlia vitaminophila TaxID=76728 RepID=A0A0T6LPV1_WENVI|nr:hypothetical protein [Wenjunlia vitaminophila]KRV48131.1 hypothetical protein AQ490_26730 [Wenjunlia vitaminophila]
MDLTGAVRRRAARRPAVFTVGWPGATRQRLEVEAEVRRRGWSTPQSPAAADLLVVCGTAPDGAATGWIDGVERAVPPPVARVTVSREGQAADALDAGQRLLATGAGPAGRAGDEAAGTPMAGRGDDRDGLRLDRLRLPLGPGLADWPAGLVLHLTLQGDVVQQVEVATVGVAGTGTAGADPVAPVPPFWDEPWLLAARGTPVTVGDAERRRCAAHLDSAGRLLATAGWADPAARFRRLRDGILAGAPAERVGPELRATAGRVLRSRTLRWLTAGLGPLPAARAREFGVTGPAFQAAGDAHDRLRVWLRTAVGGLTAFGDGTPLAPGDLAGPRGDLGRDLPPSLALLDVLPALVTGAEFAAVRTVLASLDPDLDELVASPLPGAVGG